MKRDVEKEIREHWFVNHVAELTQHGDLQVLTWREPGTRNYYVRYVFDGYNMYVSGDLGEAVFGLTWRASVHSFDDVHLDYFDSKLEAYHGDRRNFNSDKAVKHLREWVNELKENEVSYDHDDMKNLFNAARGSSSKHEWAHEVNELRDFIEEIDCDYWEWMYDIGDEFPSRLRSYLIGLKMASEQLKKVVQV